MNKELGVIQNYVNTPTVLECVNCGKQFIGKRGNYFCIDCRTKERLSVEERSKNCIVPFY